MGLELTGAVAEAVLCLGREYPDASASELVSALEYAWVDCSARARPNLVRLASEWLDDPLWRPAR
jgi:hypothetical protein